MFENLIRQTLVTPNFRCLNGAKGNNSWPPDISSLLTCLGLTSKTDHLSVYHTHPFCVRSIWLYLISSASSYKLLTVLIKELSSVRIIINTPPVFFLPTTNPSGDMNCLSSNTSCAQWSVVIINSMKSQILNIEIQITIL